MHERPVYVTHPSFIVVHRNIVQQPRSEVMTEASGNGVATLDAQETKKQRKKQAKREARAMLKLEQARQDVQKAEQKVAKAQASLEAARTRLRNSETKVEQMQQVEVHAPQQESEVATSPANLHGQEEHYQPETDSSNDGESSSNMETSAPAAGATPDTGAWSYVVGSSYAETTAPTDEPSREAPQEQESSSSQADPFFISEEDEASTGKEREAAQFAKSTALRGSPNLYRCERKAAANTSPAPVGSTSIAA